MKRPLIVICPFFAFLLTFAVLGVVMPDETASKTENRSLQQVPENVPGGGLRETADEWTAYVTDQFPYREKLLETYSNLELLQGKRFSRGNYITEDGWIMSKIYNVPEIRVDRLADVLSEAVRNSKLPFVYAVIPQKNDMLAEKAGKCFDNSISDDNKARLLKALGKLDGLKTLDVGQYFLESFSLEQREELYYRTDFHWNDYGAYKAAEWICRELETEGLLDSAGLPVTEDFSWDSFDGKNYSGDLNRQFSFLIKSEKAVPFYSVKNPEALSYYLSLDDSKPVKREEIIASGIAESELTYSRLSTENLGYYRVENPWAKSKKHILILKDSFQNPTTDYFTQVFGEVDVVDPRSCNESFYGILSKRDIDLVLFFYHQNNVSKELAAFLQPASEAFKRYCLESNS